MDCKVPLTRKRERHAHKMIWQGGITCEKVYLMIFGAVLLLTSLIASAETQRTSGLFTYTLKGNGDAVITGFNWDANNGQDIYIPRQIDGYTVSEIGANAFSSPEYVAFEYDDQWRTYKRSVGIGQRVVVVMPDTIRTIGEKAFYCTKIAAASIPGSVEFIGEGAFAGCTNLTSHTVAAENATFAVIDGVLFNKAKKELVSFPAGGEYIAYAIPTGIQAIGNYAFFGVSLPCVDRTESSRFTIASTVKKIGEYSFAYSSKHYDADLKNVEEIGDYAFYAATDINFDMPAVKAIGDYAFAYAKLKGLNETDKKDRRDEIKLPSSLVELGKGAFKGFYSFYSAHVDLSLTSLQTIPEEAFMEAYEIYDVYLPSTVKSIDAYAFKNVGKKSRSDIRSLTIPASVVSIGEGAFMNCGIQKFSFDEGSQLKTIGNDAFAKAFGYYDFGEWTIYYFHGIIELPAGIESIGDNAFNSVYITNLYIPSTINEIGNNICDRARTQLKVDAGSFAAFYASENGYGVIINGEDDTSWLND